MRIAVIQASSQKEKNLLLYNIVKNAVPQAEVFNLGVFEQEIEELSYVEVSLQVALLLESKAVDFVITGCSSGQGMMLACNSWPGVLCGFIPTPQDAFLFGRINGGNVASLPLGLGYGWCGEINLRLIVEKLFEGELGCGYPADMAERKKRDAVLVKQINTLCKNNMLEVIEILPVEFLKKSLQRTAFKDFILQQGKNKALLQRLQEKLL